MVRKVYVMSDLHGHYNIFIKMLQKIGFSSEDQLYLLGDCCDRGPDSFKIYHYIQGKDNIHLIKGNHEMMMRDAFIANNHNSKHTYLWNQNGGLKTFSSYHKHLQKKVFRPYDYQVLKAVFYKMMITYINSCPSFVELEVNGQQYVLTHAGINPKKGLDEQTEEECAWVRECFYTSRGLEGKIIIFGHTPTCHMHQDSTCFDIWVDPIYKDKIGIDGGVGGYAHGQLNCLCLSTMKVYVIKPIYTR